MGIASELCSCDDCYKGILLNLLGRIVVAENLDRAVEIAGKYGYRFRVVTLDGQVVNAGGSLTGGSLSKNTGLLGRTTEIEKLMEQSKQASKEADEMKNRLEVMLAELTELGKKQSKLQEELAVSQGDKIKLDAEIRSRNTELETTKKSLAEIRSEREASVSKMNDLTSSMERARGELDEYRKKISEYEEKAKNLSGSKDELVRKREELTEKLQQVKLNILAVQKDINTAQAEIEAAKQRKIGSDEKIKLSREETEALEKENDEFQKKISELENGAVQLSEQSAKQQLEIEAIEREKIMLEKRCAELRQREREKLSEKEKISRELARLQERRISLQNNYDETIEKLWEEYELTKREAEQHAAVIDEPSKAQRRLNELKQKIKNLGSVNVASIEEYKEVSERYRFLSEQVGDVEKSKSQLLHLIGDLTKQMREIFIDRFNLINRNFSETFVELFGGGKASLSLSDPENVLTTGIEISVEPPGKIVSHIELLSGGEKALVAIALYFAIMKVSPAPFCVMDEIEAALDDVNVYRFAEYLRRMNDRTQFICITHRRGTMEEADVLYGVTMQDRGISKLLELKASEIEQKLGMKA